MPASDLIRTYLGAASTQQLPVPFWKPKGRHGIGMYNADGAGIQARS